MFRHVHQKLYAAWASERRESEQVVQTSAHCVRVVMLPLVDACAGRVRVDVALLLPVQLAALLGHVVRVGLVEYRHRALAVARPWRGGFHGVRGW